MEKCKPLQLTKKKELQSKIKEEQNKIESRNDYLTNMRIMCGFTSDQEIKEVTDAHKRKEAVHTKLGETIEALRRSSERIVAEFKELIAGLTEDDKKEMDVIRMENRPEFETASIETLRKKYGKDFDEKAFREEKRKTDVILEHFEKPSAPGKNKGIRH